MTPDREIELKLACDPSALDALTRSPALADVGRVETTRLSSTYFDTHDRRLAGARATLRIRDLGDGRRVQTVKTAGDGLFERGEWERDVTTPDPDIALLADTPVAGLIAGDDPLDALFTVSVERTIRRVRHRRSSVEVAIDVGRVFKSEDPEASLPICEIELELKSGKAEDLFSLAGVLMQAAPLRLGVVTKSARGHALLDGRLSDVAHANPVVFAEDETAAGAFRSVANACLTQLRVNEDVMLARRDPDALHQLRVAIRRLRSAFSLFGPLLDHARFEELKAELKRLSEPLGPARDLDVFLAGALTDERERRPEEPGLKALEKQIQIRKSRAYDAALETLRSPEWRRLVVDLAGWINAGAWLFPRDPERRALVEGPARNFAASVLDKRFARLRKKSRRIAKIGDEERHQVRIAAKKLRYGVEFFSTLFENKPKREKRRVDFLKAVKKLQGRLGDLNDVANGHELMADAARSGRTRSAAFAAGVTAADVDARAEPLMEEAKAARKAFSDAKPFWR